MNRRSFFQGLFSAAALAIGRNFMPLSRVEPTPLCLLTPSEAFAKVFREVYAPAILKHMMEHHEYVHRLKRSLGIEGLRGQPERTATEVRLHLDRHDEHLAQYLRMLGQ